jgi:hypothetical protein
MGQCPVFLQWMTWMVIVGAAASTLGELERLLDDKGQDHIEVWDF